MLESIIIKEYEEIDESDIKDCDLNKLQSYLKCKNLEQVLKVTRHGIIAKSWVGVIKYKKHQFQILPKLICDNGNTENILKNLIFMLSYTKKLDIRTSDTAKLSNSKNPFIEILIREYAKSLFECLKRITPKKYVREEDNLNYLKGKIKFTENIRYNCVNQSKFYCEYDEFSENNILNQLFLFVSTCLYNISNDSYNKKTLKFIINYYSDIKLVRFNRFTAEKINLSRNQKLFKKPFNLAKMFIEKTSVDLSKNKFENITLIWDMNKLFEEFVFEIMKKFEGELGCKLVAQKGRRLLKNDTSKKRNTFVDIMVEKGDGDELERIVLDTKYKKFVSSDDFSNTDVFQVSTYCLLHNAYHAILLYPKYGTNGPDRDFELNIDEEIKEKYQIDFKTINLQYDYIGKKENLESIKEDIKRILNVA